MREFYGRNGRTRTKRVRLTGRYYIDSMGMLVTRCWGVTAAGRRYGYVRFFRRRPKVVQEVRL